MRHLQLAALLTLICFALLAVTGRLNFLAREFTSRSRRAVAVVLLAAVLTITVFYPTVSGAEMSPDLEDLWFPGLFLGHALLILFLLAWWRLRPHVSLSRLVLLHTARGRDVWRGVWVGVLGWMAALLVMGALSALTGRTALAGDSPEVPPLMVWLAELPVWRKLVIIGVSATVEEMFFRAFLQPRLGWISSSILFALAHAGYGLPMMLAGVFALSLLIGWTLEQTRRLLPCMIAHGVFNGIQLLVIMPIALKMLEEGQLV